MELIALFLIVLWQSVFMSFPHNSEDDQQSLILARSWSHPPFDFHIAMKVCNISSG